MVVIRSTLLKQWLLRVHPDRFPRAKYPKIHDENLKSVQQLNHYIDERSSRIGLPSRHPSKLHFTLVDSSNGVEASNQLKRVSLDLSSSMDRSIQRILRDCGVDIPETEDTEQSDRTGIDHQMPGSTTGKAEPRTRSNSRRRRPPQSHHSRPSDDRDERMDFGASIHDFYARTNKSNRTRKRQPVRTMRQFTAFINDRETLHLQVLRKNATQSIESLKGRFRREFGLRELRTSCGWASVPLNATVMVLLKTLRKYVAAQRDSSITSTDFFKNATIDISSEASGIDLENEFCIQLHSADVPVQWIEVLEKIDDKMLMYMDAAQKSLDELERKAAYAFGQFQVKRGLTCSALSYRVFLQQLAEDRLSGIDDALVRSIRIVVEEDHVKWDILEDGSVQLPACATIDDVLNFLKTYDSSIQDQEDAYARAQQEFSSLQTECKRMMGVSEILRGKTIALDDAITACRNLLQVARLHPSDPEARRLGLNEPLGKSLRSHTIRIDRTFGLSPDGVFTLPWDWYHV